MGVVKTQYTKYARNAVFGKVLIKNDFPCISQFVSLLFELLLQPFRSLSGEFFCAGCYKQGYRLHKTTSEKTKNGKCSMNSSSPHPDTNFNPVIPHPANTFNPESRLLFASYLESRIPENVWGPSYVYEDQLNLTHDSLLFSVLKDN